MNRGEGEKTGAEDKKGERIDRWREEEERKGEL